MAETFADLGISEDIIKAMNEMGWNQPTPIQIESVPLGMEGHDLLAQAQTGTGKTGAYASIILSLIPSRRRYPSALVLSPTRELASQISQEFFKLSKYSGHKGVAIYGGANISTQTNMLRRGADIIIGTPGRLKDMITRKDLDLSQISTVVLDESDRMLDMGFSDEVNFILDRVQKKRQTMMFSATMNENVKKLAYKHTHKPCEISVSSGKPIMDTIKQFFIPVNKNEKKDVLVDLLKESDKAIVFCGTKYMVDNLTVKLRNEGIKADAIHGDMRQSKRESTIKSLKGGQIAVLVATDVAARGLDIDDIDHVVNFDVPGDAETYVHRIGRTGRAGKQGNAVTMITSKESWRLDSYESATGKKIGRWNWDFVRNDTEKKPVVQEVIPEEVKPEPKKPVVMIRKNKGTASKSGSSILELNFGKSDDVKKRDIVDIIMMSQATKEENIGRVAIGDKSSFIEMNESSPEDVITGLMKQKYNGKAITIRLAPPKAKYKEKPRRR